MNEIHLYFTALLIQELVRPFLVAEIALLRVFERRIMKASPSLAQKAAALQLRRDYILKAWTPRLKLTLVNSTRTAQDGCRRHHVKENAGAALLAKALTGSALISASLKGEERAILQLVEDGGAQSYRLYAEAMACGEVRGYLSPHDWPPGLTRLNPANSMLSVTSILYNKATPVQSLVKCVEGDVASDLQSYFDRSVQVPSAVHLEVSMDGSDSIDYAGGLLAQRIAVKGGVRSHDCADYDDHRYEEDLCPSTGKPWTTLDDIKQRVHSAKQGSHGASSQLLGLLAHDNEEGKSSDAAGEQMLSPPFSLADCYRQGMTLQDIARALIPELATLPEGTGGIGQQQQQRDNNNELEKQQDSGMGMSRIPLDFYCRCSKHRFLGKLGQSSTSLIEELLKQGQEERLSKNDPSVADPAAHVCTSLTCQFCNTSYDVTEGDLQTLLAQDAAAGAVTAEQSREPLR